MSVNKRATKSEVLAIPAPEFTKTWRPISHGKVITLLDDTLKSLGIPVINQNYTTIHSGSRLFGSYTLDIAGGSPGMKYELGFRNAIDKSMALGFVAGTRVMVCSNMMFSGEFIEFAKHTSTLTDDRLLELTSNAASGAIIEMKKVQEWHESLHDYYVPSNDFKELTYNMIDKGVFPGSQFHNFLKCVEEEKATNFGSTTAATDLYTVHGGATRLMRKDGLHQIQNSSRALRVVVDDYLLQKAA